MYTRISERIGAPMMIGDKIRQCTAWIPENGCRSLMSNDISAIRWLWVCVVLCARLSQCSDVCQILWQMLYRVHVRNHSFADDKIEIICVASAAFVECSSVWTWSLAIRLMMLVVAVFSVETRVVIMPWLNECVGILSIDEHSTISSSSAPIPREWTIVSL